MDEAGETGAEKETEASLVPVQCKDCEFWYGAEDDGYGPCDIKNGRGDARFVTFGTHRCDEVYRHGRPAPAGP